MNVNEYVSALPDSYKKHSESNNYKLLQLEQGLISAFRTDIEAVQETLNIYTATGETLDHYGETYSQPRGSMTDEQYRYIILQKVARSQVKGDANSVILALASAFNVDPSAFNIADTENICEVAVTELPFSILQHAGLTGKQMEQIIESLLPVGVRLAPLNLEGTFEFAATYGEQDDEAGFGDIAQTVGGYFGYLATNDIDIPT